ncbi:MAG: hypothetical protein IPN34_23065 [Planctomycetes bacterium]|nr:hypothetical protein [Planctomycetota bacterium]
MSLRASSTMHRGRYRFLGGPAGDDATGFAIKLFGLAVLTAIFVSATWLLLGEKLFLTGWLAPAPATWNELVARTETEYRFAMWCAERRQWIVEHFLFAPGDRYQVATSLFLHTTWRSGLLALGAFGWFGLRALLGLRRGKLLVLLMPPLLQAALLPQAAVEAPICGSWPWAMCFAPLVLLNPSESTHQRLLALLFLASIAMEITLLLDGVGLPRIQLLPHFAFGVVSAGVMRLLRSYQAPPTHEL